MRLFHFSENPAIEVFAPRELANPKPRPPGREWLNGPLVWAIEERFQFLYFFPRNCPRIVIWAEPQTKELERQKWLGDRKAAAYVEHDWMAAMRTTTIYRYHLPIDGFTDLQDAGMWVAESTIIPRSCEPVSNLEAALEAMHVELRPVDRLTFLRALWDTGLHVSGIRLSKAKGWDEVDPDGRTDP
ncbi:DUF6886 family protein [Oryzifoliimicrobium ureilyticus]|uniref:DUF6886 family protein n=1 Tax=Oryzifoliimicrobium ureilyticus TaxID=3113724 RepID=UPI00307627C0